LIVPFFYLTGWLVVRLIMAIYARIEVIGAENVPRRGGLIIVSNHLNNADPGMVGAFLHRRVTYMAKDEMFQWPLFGGYIRLIGAFPVRRFEGDLKALRQAVQVVRRGQALVMFPEGTRSTTGAMTRGHPGTSMVALRAGAPILPVAITGSEVVRLPSAFLRPFRRTKIRMVVGQPFFLPSVRRPRADDIERCTDIIMGHIADLLPPQYRGYYQDKTVSATEPVAQQPKAALTAREHGDHQGR
jgi:1-acyl-sn-glycerol-3-phosphate acyltransferase